MTGPDLLAWSVVILLSVEVVRRLPAAVRHQRGRTLWYVYAAFDISMITRFDAVGDGLYDLTGVDDVATLAKHLTGIAAVGALLHWVTATVPGRMDGRREPGYRRAISSRPRRVATWLIVVLTTAVFPAASRRPGNEEDADFIFAQAGHFWGTLHLLLFYAYMVFGTVCASMMCAAAARQPGAKGAFRTGMQLLGLGCAVGSLYGILRSAYLVARLAGKPFLGGDTFVDVASGFALIGTVVLCVLGAAAPAWERMSARIDAHGALNDIRPMWATLVRAVPSVCYDDPAGDDGRLARVLARTPRLRARLRYARVALFDFCNWRKADLRLRTRITEICDASLHVQQYLPSTLRHEADRAVKALELPSYITPAYLLWTGVRHLKTGKEPCREPLGEAILKPGSDPLQATRALLPIGQAMCDKSVMRRLERRLAAE